MLKKGAEQRAPAQEGFKGKSACAGETVADLGSALWVKPIIASNPQMENSSIRGYLDVPNVSLSGFYSTDSHYCS